MSSIQPELAELFNRRPGCVTLVCSDGWTKYVMTRIGSNKVPRRGITQHLVPVPGSFQHWVCSNGYLRYVIIHTFREMWTGTRRCANYVMLWLFRFKRERTGSWSPTKYSKWAICLLLIKPRHAYPLICNHGLSTLHFRYNRHHFRSSVTGEFESSIICGQWSPFFRFCGTVVKCWGITCVQFTRLVFFEWFLLLAASRCIRLALRRYDERGWQSLLKFEWWQS